MVGGVFTTDLDFAATLLGHHGAPAKWLRMYCLAQQDKLQGMFEGARSKRTRYDKRTLKDMCECYQIYKEQYESLPKNEQTKETRATVIKEVTNTIVAETLMDIPLNIWPKSTLHVILGWTKKLTAFPL